MRAKGLRRTSQRRLLGDAPKSRVHDETGFKPDVVRLEMGGTCRACQE